MKRNMLRFIGIVLTFVLLLASFVGCTNNEKQVINTKYYADMNFNDEAIEEGVICENNSFVLSWNDIYKQVEITDKKSGKTYSTMPESAKEITYDEDGYEIKNNPLVESPIIVYYYIPKTVSESSAVAATETIYEDGVYTEKINNGIRVTYDFINLDISVPVEYTIAEDCFEITIHPEQISDNGVNYVTGVALAPFLVSTENDKEDSYLFYPDGSGALIKPDTIDLIGKKVTKRVYGDDLLIYKSTLNSYTKDIRFPVFGAKSQDNAIFGIISSASEQAYLELNVGASNIGYSTVYPFFRIRGYNLVGRPQRLYIAEPEVKVFDKKISTSPLTVSYFTLSGEEADYNGMAEIYRNYLINNGELTENGNTDVAVSIDILGGLEEKKFTFGIPHTALKSLTTIKQAQEMADYYSKNINGSILMNLVGFGSSGLDFGEAAGGFKIDSLFGSKEEIKNISSFCKNNDIKLSIDFDLLRFNKSGSGFSNNADAAKLHNGQTAYLQLLDNVTRNETDERYSILSRKKLADAVERCIDITDEYGMYCISLESLTSSIYADYSMDGAEVAAGMGDAVSQLLNTVRKTKTVISNDANVFAATNSDYITNVPTYSSKEDIYWKDIPFYQMIFKGYIPMSIEPINLTANDKQAMLRCVETGISPKFTCAYEYDSSVVASKFSSLYASDYNGMRENVTEMANSVNIVLQKVAGAKITNHTIEENDLRITEYDNGVIIAVNYTDKELEFNNNKIAAENYIIQEG